MAEREGFEPPIPVKVCPLSRRIVSTTHAPLRAVRLVVALYFIRCYKSVARSVLDCGLPKLFVPESFNGVNLHGPSCRHVARQQRDGRE